MNNIWPLLFLILFIFTGIFCMMKGYNSFEEYNIERDKAAGELSSSKAKSRTVYDGDGTPVVFDVDSNMSVWPVSKIRQHEHDAFQQAAAGDVQTLIVKDYVRNLDQRLSQMRSQTELFEKYAETGTAGADSAEEEKKKVIKRLRGELDDLNSVYDRDQRDLTRQKDLIQDSIDDEDTQFAGYKKVRSRRFSVQKTLLGNEKSRLNTIIKRPRVKANLDSDGMVIYSDPITRKVVINIGSDHGVLPGMQFEVYNILTGQGHKRMTKGYILVQEVAPLHSSCISRLDELQLNTDPVSGLTATEPEMKYSPVTVRGMDVMRPQPMSGRAVIVLRGPKKDHPIVEGDQIQCPFFERNRKLNFLVLGDKDLEHSEKKILQILREYGCNVVDKVTPEVDLVLVRNWNFISEAETVMTPVNQLGLKVVYEVEILPFLRDK